MSQGINFWVNGVVAMRNKQPYVQLSNENGLIGQFTMAEARKIAQDILVMASRTEADAMIIKFFDKAEFPTGAAAALMNDFRDFRMGLDEEKVDGSYGDPEAEG
jgi:hypothetical protein